MDFNKENFDDYSLRTINERSKNGFEFDDAYTLIVGEENRVSNEESRKRLSGIKAYLMRKLELSNIEASEEIQRLSQKESIEVREDGSAILEKYVVAMEEDFKTPERILEIVGYDPKLWTLKKSKISKWNVSHGDLPNKLLYSIRCEVEPKIQEFDIEWSKEVFKELKSLPSIKSEKQRKTNKVVFVSLADLHYGLRGLDYEQQTKVVFDEIALEYKYADTIILPIGNDILHYNSENGANKSTVKGTSLEATLDYDEMFKSGLRAMCHLIDRLLEETNATIHTLYIPSNHDKYSTFGLYQSLCQRYRNIGRVLLDDTVAPRKYVNYGKVGLMIAHGDEEGKRLFTLFPIEAPEIFAKSTCREGMLYHLHNESVKDEAGVTYRRLPTLNKADKWHTEKGYLGSFNRMQVFVYDSSLGRLNRIDQYYLD